MFEPWNVLRVSFLIATFTILSLNRFPALRSRFITYGPRSEIPDPGYRQRAENNNCQKAPGASSTLTTGLRSRYGSILDPKPPDRLLESQVPKQMVNASEGRLIVMLDTLSTIKVPHQWFTHFYIVSVVSSIFWGIQIFIQGPFLRAFHNRGELETPRNTMSVDQVVLVWTIMIIQGIRRLLESLVTKSSCSSMFFAHWLLGIAFYLAMGVTVWIEGIDALLSKEPPCGNITLSSPSVRTLLSIPVFLVASGIQHDCHMYLASLPKYTLPVHPMFQFVICPHYMAECFIYLSLALLAAPNGALVNMTFFTALIFVSVNLSISASTTKEWYVKRFGKDKIIARWKILPYVF